MSERVDIVVIGAGPAGLATAACLGELGVECVVLEREREVGSTWRRHYERLHLHTVKQHSALPMMPWAKTVPTYPSRREVVEYLDAYADRFRLRPRFGQRVVSARRAGGGFRVRTDDAELSARFLVVATGYNRTPKRPTWPGMDRFRGAILHSSEYKTGAAWKGRRALVVGVGNSGAEIALDLWEHGAHTDVCVRSPVHVVPRDLFGVPAQISGLMFSRLPPKVADRISLALLDRAVGDLSPWGFRRPAIGPISQVIERGRVPLIDVGTIEMIKQGKIGVVPGIDRFTASGVVLSDGREREYDLVLLATGYRAALEDLLEGAGDLVDDRGYPRVHGAEAAPGLYFVGFRNPPTGQLRDIALEAARVAADVKRRLRG